MAVLLEALLKEGFITQEQLKGAQEKQIGAKRPIQELLVEMGFIKEEDLIKASSVVFNMPVSNLKDEPVDTTLMKIISYEVVRRYGVFPVCKQNDALLLAMSNPQDIIALDDIKAITNMDIKSILSTKGDISECIEKYYNADDKLYDLFKNLAEDVKVEIINKEIDSPEGLGIAGHHIEAPVVRLVNFILIDAIKRRASDIHIEPQEDSVRVKYRIDGDMRNITQFSSKLLNSVVARIKILADLDVAETRKPQDGRAAISAQDRKIDTFGGVQTPPFRAGKENAALSINTEQTPAFRPEFRSIDLRVSVVPTHYGEKVVLRLLDIKKANVLLDVLGLTEGELSLFKDAINMPQGMILVTGPTGSGKTSTIYAALNFIKDKTKNIITIEDPIEYSIDGISQIQVNPIKDVTFANGLRSILRQDPDVILVGEIRDKETADIAFRSSLTGHLVFTTLHTNSSVASITRLLDMELKPYLISSSIALIVAQRLIKLICPHCKEQYFPEENVLQKYAFYLDKYRINEFYKGKGCDKCGYSGFLGRTAIFEMLSNNEKIRALISKKASEDDIFQEAIKSGLRPLAESGLEKVAQGVTTIEEVAKVADIIAQEMEPGKSKREKLKILVTDDDTLVRKMVISAFKEEMDTYEFIEAQDGSEAVRLVYQSKPDLLICDVMMPKMGGYEVAKILRSHLETVSLPLVMLTTRSDKESEIKGLDCGADDYIAKPFDKDKFLARVKVLLRRRG